MDRHLKCTPPIIKTNRILRNADGVVGSLVSSALLNETITCVHYDRKYNM